MKCARRHRGLTVVELVFVVATISILAAIVVIRIGEIHQKARDDREKANVNLLQAAYEEAKMQQPSILSNQIVFFLVRDLRDKGFLSFAMPTTNITLVPRTYITNGTALFVLGSNDDPANTNLLQGIPFIFLASPANGGTFRVGQPVLIMADVTMPPGDAIDHVDLFEGTTKLTTLTNAPYSYSFMPDNGGSYAIMAKVTTTRGKTATSFASMIYSGDNIMPVVNLTTPINNQRFSLPITLNLTASASDPDGKVVRVDFLVEGSVIGSSTTTPYGTTWNPPPSRHLSSNCACHRQPQCNCPGQRHDYRSGQSGSDRDMVQT